MTLTLMRAGHLTLMCMQDHLTLICMQDHLTLIACRTRDPQYGHLTLMYACTRQLFFCY